MRLTVRLGNTMFRVLFLVAERLAVERFIGNSFLKRYVPEIRCEEQKVQLRSELITILQKQDGTTNQGNPYSERTDPKATRLETNGRNPKRGQRREARSDTGLTRVRMSREITPGPYRQIKATVETSAQALVTLEP